MLFLDALFFFLLGTSALAIPVPGWRQGAFLRGIQEIFNPSGPFVYRVNGVWRSDIIFVSERRSFDSTYY